MPLLASQVDTSEPFAPSEVLYRRVSPIEILENGELDPSRFDIREFTKDVSGSPSVVRSRFAYPEDVLHPDCANGKTYDGYLIYRITVADLPQEIHSADGKVFATYPVHRPEKTCGAHSVIATCLADDPDRKYAKPSRRTVLNDLRAKLALAFKAQPVHELIAKRAYELWETQGRPDTGQEQRWITAERDLMAH